MTVSLAPGLAGVDEAGRGPLAGPVVAAAVILGSGFQYEAFQTKKRRGKPRDKKGRAGLVDRASERHRNRSIQYPHGDAHRDAASCLGADL